MTTIAYTLAVFVYALGVAIIALCWVLSMKRTYESSAKEDAARIAERRFAEMCESAEYRVYCDQYIICGQGYHEQEDKITMTRSTELQRGGLYVHISGQVYKCLRLTDNGCAVLMNLNDGELLTVRGCREYQDGKIEFHIVESIRLAGAAV